MSPRTRRTRTTRTLACTILLSIAWIAGQAHGIVGYSVDNTSATGAVTGGDVLTPGARGTARSVPLSRAFLGLALGDELDALSTGVASVGLTVYYSVTTTSLASGGAPHYYVDIPNQAVRGQWAGDVWYWDNFGSVSNDQQLFLNQAALGSIPSILPPVYTTVAQENLDALDMVQGYDFIFFSVGANTSNLGRADILYYTRNGPQVFLSAAQLGLRSGDDIDALQMSVGQIFFSLRPGSPTLSTLSASPSDILRYDPSLTPPLQIGISRSAFGLTANDDIDALAFSDTNLSADADNDLIVDAVDNCRTVPNTTQRDGDGDGCGNACDFDLDQDWIPSLADLAIFASCTTPECDFNTDRAINNLDRNLLVAAIAAVTTPGPGVPGMCP